MFVVDGDVLDGVGGQVLEHELAVVAEELLAVEQQVVHELAFVVDASVRLHLHARQLTDECVEHGTFGQDEGVGVVDDGVALVVELYLRGGDGHLFHCAGLWRQVEGRQTAFVLAPAYFVDAVLHVGGLIAHEADAEEVFGGLGRHGEGELAGLPREALGVPLLVGFLLLDDRAVGAHQHHRGTEQVLVGTDVLHHALQLQLAHHLCPFVLHIDVISMHFHLHGQTLARPLDGRHGVQPIDLSLGRQLFETVGGDVDGVVRLALGDGL